MGEDAFDLRRFVDAQAGAYELALAEIRSGEKRTHWMWFVFPQIRGLGASAITHRYAISGREEARAYLAHPVLGPRLVECAEAVLAVHNRTAEEMFPWPDDLKLRSSATLFAHVSPPGSVFERLIAKCFDGPDARTVALLQG